MSSAWPPPAEIDAAGPARATAASVTSRSSVTMVAWRRLARASVELFRPLSPRGWPTPVRPARRRRRGTAAAPPMLMDAAAVVRWAGPHTPEGMAGRLNVTAQAPDAQVAPAASGTASRGIQSEDSSALGSRGDGPPDRPPASAGVDEHVGGRAQAGNRRPHARRSRRTGRSLPVASSPPRRYLQALQPRWTGGGTGARGAHDRAAGGPERSEADTLLVTPGTDRALRQLPPCSTRPPAGLGGGAPTARHQHLAPGRGGIALGPSSSWPATSRTPAPPAAVRAFVSICPPCWSSSACWPSPA